MTRTPVRDSREERESEESYIIDFSRMLLILWHRKKWLALGTFLSVLGAFLYCLFAQPLYQSKATISAQSNAGQNAMFAQLGLLGVQNTALHKMEIYLKGYQLAESIVLQYDLLPILFPDRWDSTSSSWRDSSQIPPLRSGVGALRKMLEVNSNSSRGIITLSVYAPDPILAQKLVLWYLEALNSKLRKDVMAEAESDRMYLEEQLLRIQDPRLAERTLSLISTQIERGMLVSTRALEVLEPPLVPSGKDSPRTLKILAVALVLGFMASVVGTFAWQWVRGIHRDVLRTRVS